MVWLRGGARLLKACQPQFTGSVWKTVRVANCRAFDHGESFLNDPFEYLFYFLLDVQFFLCILSLFVLEIKAPPIFCNLSHLVILF